LAFINRQLDTPYDGSSLSFFSVAPKLNTALLAGAAGFSAVFARCYRSFSSQVVVRCVKKAHGNY
jgi:hypothetical protein